MNNDFSNLQKKLKSGKFVFTAETSPPDSSNPQTVLDRVKPLIDVADAVNVTDGAGAKAHMSAFATAVTLSRNGVDPILQITLRDRNRIAIQGDLIGASSLGIHNILCLHGDPPTAGDQPETKGVYDLDTKELINMARVMRDEGCYPSGRRIDRAPEIFIGAADMPHKPQSEYEPKNIQAKIESGAGFFQTQYAFDIEVLRSYMSMLNDFGICEKAYMLIGLGPFPSSKSARWMNDNLKGVNVPEAIIKRLESSKDPKEESKKICLELIEQFREIKGIHGVHLMGPKQESAISSIIKEASL